MAAGIETRHGRRCQSRAEGNCNCRPTYQAHVWSARDGKRIRKTFPTHAAAKAWRRDALVKIDQGTLRGAAPTTVRQGFDAWLEGARKGTVTNRSGDAYKPSAIRAYESSMRLRVLPEIGATRLADVRRVDLQDLADKFYADGLSPSTVQCTLLPLRAMYRRALARGEVAVNPTTGLELPAVRGGRDRIAPPEEAAGLLAVLPDDDRATWATAMYAGLRRGELRALRAGSVDFEAGVIHVTRGWDAKEGEIETKDRKRRKVPIPSVLRKHLLRHVARSGRRGDDLLFGRTAALPFDTRGLSERADEAWKDAELARITLHECRHTYASLMIAAGVNAKTLSTYMGHANIAITMDRYGHLMPGNEDEAAGLLDDYLTRAVEG